VFNGAEGLFQVRINTGKAFVAVSGFQNVAPVPGHPFYPSQINLEDLNGDRLLDRFIKPDPDFNNKMYVQLSAGPFPDLLSKIENGYGGQVTVSYKPSTLYNNKNDSGQSMLSFPVYTVSSTVVFGGVGTAVTNEYDYAGGFFHPTRREFVGFANVTVTEAHLHKTKMYFHQSGGLNGTSLGEWQDADSVAKRGMPYRVETIGTNGQIYHVTLSKVEEIAQTGEAAFAYVSQRVEMDYEGTAAYRATATQFLPDTSNGNLLTESRLGEVTGVDAAAGTFVNPGPKLYVHTSYTNIGNIRGRPVQIKITSDAGGTDANRLQESRMGYDARGNLADKKVWHNGPFTSVLHNTYDNYGNVFTSVDAKGVFSQYAYDTTHTFVQSKTSAPGFPPYYFVYDRRSGQLIMSVEPSGMVVSNAYDALLRITQSSIASVAFGLADIWKTKYDYHLGGMTAGISDNYVRQRVNDATDANGHETYEYTDGLGRTIQTRSESERGGGIFRVTHTIYDHAGRIQFVTQPFFTNGVLFTELRGTNVGRLIEYEAIGRVSKEWGSLPLITSDTSTNWGSLNGDDGSVAGYSSVEYRDGNTLWTSVHTDAKGSIRKHLADGFGRTWKIEEKNGANTYNTLYGYDLLSQLTKITNHVNHVTTVEYDSLGNKTRLVDPDAGEWLYLSDAAGRLLTQRDPNGHFIDFDYDYLGRLTTKWVYNYNGGTLVNVVSYRYYPSYGLTGFFDQLGSVTDMFSSEYYGYDFRGRRTTKRAINEDGDFTFQHTYDVADRVSEITYLNNALKVKYNYDGGGNMHRVDVLAGGPAPITGIIYEVGSFNELGKPESFTLGNGLETIRDFHFITKRLKNLQTEKPASGYYQDVSYTYDAVGNVLSITDHDPAHIANTITSEFTAMQYDDLHRLLAYSRNGVITSFTYDPLGNLQSNGELTGSSYQYSSRPHAVMQTTSTKNYNYDAAGNMIYRPCQYLSYDEQNRLSLLYNCGVITTYAYTDAGQLLLQRGNNGAVTRCWIDNLYERDESRVWLHVMVGGKRIASFNPQATTALYPIHDALGSVRVVSDRYGALLEQNVFKAYGNVAYGPTGFMYSMARYTGQTFIRGTESPYAGSGIYWYGSRFYDPEIGRFIQPDTIVPSPSDPQTLNRYSYVLNNPFKYNDPTGHWPEWLYNLVPQSFVQWTIGGKAPTPPPSAPDPAAGLGAMSMQRDEIGGYDTESTTKPLSRVLKAGAELNPLVAGVNGGHEMIKGEDSVFRGQQLDNGERMSGGGKAAGAGFWFSKMFRFGKGARDAVKETTYLYQKVGANGEHLKYGITVNPATRYSAAQLNGGQLRIIAKGENSTMLSLERKLHETMPIGPEEGQLFYIQKQIDNGLSAPPY